MSRLKNTARNIYFGYISSILSLGLGFIARTVFIHVLGTTYLGINGLFTNLLTVLSFAELGIGTAINYSLYNPVAKHDMEKIKSIMMFYKVAYMLIALVITVVGVGIIPFLDNIIKGADAIYNIKTYYMIFLFNTVSSYFVTYKFSLVNAEQKNYIYTNINTIVNIIIVIIQIIVLLVFKNFIVYLLSAAIIGLVQKIFINNYLNKMYPYLLDKPIKKLSKEELAPIKKNVAALVWHKIGEISVHQTDNIIISAFINIGMVGLISNYNLIMVSVSGFVNIIFNSATASFGNLMAVESKERQYELFKIYRFLAFWLYGFSSVAFIILMTPFIVLWIGTKMVVTAPVILLMVINYYMLGHRICINNIKSASGVFNQDKYLSLIQAMVNLVVSIVGVKLIGLPGVYVGTIMQGLICSIVRPIIIYKHIFNVNPINYFVDSVKFGVIVVIAGVICYLFQIYVASSVTIPNLLIMMAIVILVPNVLFYTFFQRREEFVSIQRLVVSIIRG